MNQTEAAYAKSLDTKRFAGLEVGRDHKTIVCGLCGSKICDIETGLAFPAALEAAEQRYGYCCKACASTIQTLNVSGIDLAHLLRIVKNMVAGSLEQHWIYEHKNS